MRRTPNRQLFTLGLFAALLCGVAALAPDARAADLTGEEIYKKALKSTVWIVVPDGNKAAMGSGSLIDARQKLILTNYHVVMGKKDTIFVQFPLFDAKGRKVSERDTYMNAIQSNGALVATVLYEDKTKDLAILQLKNQALPKGVEAVRLAEDAPGPGAKVHSVGNPGASEALFVYSPGEVRSVYQKKWAARGGSEVLQLDAQIIESTSPTSPGDSGGPLFNSKGEQVGVTQGGLVDPKATGYSYFIEVSEVKAMLKRAKVNLSPRAPAAETVSAPPKKEMEPEEKADTAKKVEPKPEAKKESTAAADARAAESRLGLIKTLIEQGKKDTAMTRLTDLIKQYPNTEAAQEAKELLKKLK